MANVLERVGEKGWKYVIWSGGFDSTAVLLEQVKTASVDEPVHTLSITHHNIESDQQRLERKARDKLFDEFESRWEGHIKRHEIMIKDDNDMILNVTAYPLPQQTIWAALAPLYVPNGATIYFGYIRGDDYWHHHEEFENIIKAICKLSNHEVEIEYPFEWKSKQEVIDMLKEEKLLDLCWTCSEPRSNDTRCGQCHKCKALKRCL